MKVDIHELLDNLQDLQVEYEAEASQSRDHIQHQITLHMGEFVGRLRDAIEESTDRNADQEEFPI